VDVYKYMRPRDRHIFRHAKPQAKVLVIEVSFLIAVILVRISVLCINNGFSMKWSAHLAKMIPASDESTPLGASTHLDHKFFCLPHAVTQQQFPPSSLRGDESAHPYR
jgi:hypothetical protein